MLRAAHGNPEKQEVPKRRPDIFFKLCYTLLRYQCVFGHFEYSPEFLDGQNMTGLLNAPYIYPMILVKIHVLPRLAVVLPPTVGAQAAAETIVSCWGPKTTCVAANTTRNWVFNILCCLSIYLSVCLSIYLSI